MKLSVSAEGFFYECYFKICHNIRIVLIKFFCCCKGIGITLVHDSAVGIVHVIKIISSLQPSPKLSEDERVREIQSEFQNDVFWHELVARLAERDVAGDQTKRAMETPGVEPPPSREDQLKQVETRYWDEFEKNDLAHVVVAHRPGWKAPITGPLGEVMVDRGTGSVRDLHQSTAGRVFVHAVTQLEIASTDLRALIQAGRDLRYLVPGAPGDSSTGPSMQARRSRPAEPGVAYAGRLLRAASRRTLNWIFMISMIFATCGQRNACQLVGCAAAI